MTTMHVTRLVLMIVGALALVPGILVYNDYRGDLQRAYKRIATGSHIVQTACGPIEYAVAGAGPPVLVVHGAGGGFDQGMEFGQALVDRGFRVIAMSRFGYLGTPLPPDASPQAQADAHACLLDALQVRRVTVVSASAGAPSSLQFALRHPDRIRALALLVPAAYVPRPGNAAPLSTPPGTELMFDTVLRSDLLFWMTTRVARDTVVRAILATPPAIVAGATVEERQRIDDVLKHILPVSPRRLGLINDARVVLTLPRYDLERIAAPTLVVSIEDDPYGTWASARYTAEHIPRARFVGYATGGHLWVGHHREIVDEIAGFVANNSKD
jgi:2-hydroxy-6-oxonona-2,4-dienedioate hydrolase